jgi:hypothetical protein
VGDHQVQALVVGGLRGDQLEHGLWGRRERQEQRPYGHQRKAECVRRQVRRGALPRF